MITLRAGHGIARTEGQTQHGIFQLSRSDAHRPYSRLADLTNLDIAGERKWQQFVHASDQRRQINHACIQHVSARENQQATGQIGAGHGGIQGGLGPRRRRGRSRKERRQQLQVDGGMHGQQSAKNTCGTPPVQTGGQALRIFCAEESSSASRGIGFGDIARSREADKHSSDHAR